MERENSHVLVVDDQDSGRFVKSQLLRRAGFTVYEAATGQEAIDLARKRPMDLIVLDVNLPDMNGLDVGRVLRAEQPGPPALQILHVSSTAVADSDRVKGLNAGADAYLSEPMDSSVLVATARALLRVRRAEESLAEALANEQHARNEAEQANRLKDEFIATLSHELRTPLNALMGWIWQLRQETLDETGREKALDSLERNTRIQAQLINDLLDVSRITKGKLQLQMRLLDLGSVATDAAESVREVAVRKHVALNVSAASVCVAGDAGRLQQVVSNLLNNAIQFTPTGGMITLTVERDAGDAVVRVADSGAGIDPVLLPYVFEPFRQGKHGLTRAHGGLGLGLAVVQQLIELHGGHVSVTSEGPGSGSTFTVRLPESEGESETGLLLSGLAVLVVADSTEGRETLTAILESSGAHVAQQPDGQAFRPPDSSFDVLVSDRAREIVISSPSTPAANPVSVAAELHLAKPIRAGGLVRALATFVRKRSG